MCCEKINKITCCCCQAHFYWLYILMTHICMALCGFAVLYFIFPPIIYETESIIFYFHHWFFHIQLNYHHNFQYKYSISINDFTNVMTWKISQNIVIEQVLHTDIPMIKLITKRIFMVIFTSNHFREFSKKMLIINSSEVMN